MKKNKEEESKDGFKIGDYVRNTKTGVMGQIAGFEWSGVKRALIKEYENSKDYKVIAITELELVMKEEPVEIE